MKVFLHVEDFDGDSLDIDSCAVLAELPALPRKGDTCFLSTGHQKEILRKILQTKSRCQAWCNLMVEDEEPFLSLQGYFNVEDVWFKTDDGSVHVLLSDDIKMKYHEIDDILWRKLKDNFDKGHMFY